MNRTQETARVVVLAPDVGQPLHALVVEVRAQVEACLAADQALLLLSSAEAYGDNPFLLGHEARSWVGSERATAWLAAEQVVRAGGDEGLVFGIARVAEVYGPGEHGVVGQMLDALEDGRPLDAEEGELSLCFVDDARAAIGRLSRALVEGEALGGPVNVASERCVSVAFLASEIERLAGRSPRAFSDLGSRRGLDLSRLEALGDWAPTGLEAGLTRTLAARGLLADDPAAARIDVPFLRPNLAVGDRLAHRVGAAVHSGRMSNDGPRVAELEERLAAWLGVPEVVVLCSGSMALFAAAGTLERPGAVVLPSFTFPATASAFALLGRELVFADIDPDTFTLAPGAVVADRPVAAVVPVTVYGVPPDLAGLAAVAAELGAELLVDDAHGLGSRCPVPTGTVRTFSLHATKMLAAAEGGAVAGPPERLEAIRWFRNHGRGRELLDVGPGLNARMDELRASLALEQLDRLPELVARRRADAAVLRGALEGAGWRVQRVPDGVVCGFQNLGARLPGVSAERVVHAFRARGIEARRYFHPLLHQTQGFRSQRPLPTTEALHAELVCLPLHNQMHPRELAAVRDAIGPVTEALCP